MKNNRANKILLIDEDTLLTAELAGRLSSVGFDILTANNSDTALKLLQINMPTLIVLDTFVKGKDGKDILSTLKTMGISPDIPIIVLTSDTDVNSKVYSFLQGASDFIPKPVIFEELLARINNQIRLSSERNKLEARNKELKKKNSLLSQIAITDSLTGLFNRGYIIERLKSEMHRAQRYGEYISLLLIDIDNFKEANDTYGHLSGDKILKKVSKRLASSIRNVDIVGRYGGDEFLTVCPNTDIDGSKILAERIMETINNRKIKLDNHNIIITVSMGVSSISPKPGGSIDSDVIRFINDADAALYKAKARGRNNVVISDGSITSTNTVLREKITLEYPQSLDEYSN